MLNTPNHSILGKFIWHDLAAADTAAALDFYRHVFGWTSITENANGGQFIRLQSNGQDVGSMYALSRREREHGVPSHWTTYIGVDSLEVAVHKVEEAGGVILVQPFTVDNISRIALVADSLGSVLGLWEAL
jgi:predicted enzyme related to lactoylglutathione lyase